ncbi:MAG: type I CRISPR-associated protein Cas7 [Syntrophobacteraceae bacterium]|jgi:CRISPR/Cas system type I-B associated protein Csh2 (Cas7 group RAMP superfamily)
MTNSDNGNDILRATGLIVVEVRNSNPNGDPERDGAPRKRKGDIGEISPVSVKRKMRDLVANKRGPIWLYLKSKFSLDDVRFEILEERDKNPSSIKKMILDDRLKPIEDMAFVKRFWDARIFGNTFLEKAEGGSEKDTENQAAGKKTGDGKSKKAEETLALKKSVKTGVLHFGLGLSVAPVTIRTDFTLTNKAGVEEEKTGGMAPGAFKFVEHGVYAIPFFVNPTQASHTGCTKQDVDVALELIPYVYSHNRSLVRTQVEVLHAWYMEHGNQKGSCSDFDLIDALTPRKKGNNEKPSLTRAEYEIPTSLPEKLQDRIVLRDLMDLMRE